MLSEKVTLISLGRSDSHNQLGTPRCNAPIIIKNIQFPMSDIYCPMSNVLIVYWILHWPRPAVGKIAASPLLTLLPIDSQINFDSSLLLPTQVYCD